MILPSVKLKLLRIVLPSQDDPGSNAESNVEQQLSLVSKWLQSAKEENRNAMEALNKTECPQDVKTRLGLAKNELGQVDTASVQSAWLDLRRALRRETSALQSMLKKIQDHWGWAV
ncbi:unnamed protein product [Nippostrongylus brasiliensis]|uniref:Nesprin-1-like n=1 Tax=Nippostrongylus brasiliensis TaxID=27835 RepID=A0A0N4YZP9_NIPBR|nr:unnamed protein product [Nippostrongylus brasiliensis]